jgi:hypothetical protein
MGTRVQGGVAVDRSVCVRRRGLLRVTPVRMGLLRQLSRGRVRATWERESDAVAETGVRVSASRLRTRRDARQSGTGRPRMWSGACGAGEAVHRQSRAPVKASVGKVEQWRQKGPSGAVVEAWRRSRQENLQGTLEPRLCRRQGVSASAMRPGAPGHKMVGVATLGSVGMRPLGSRGNATVPGRGRKVASERVGARKSLQAATAGKAGAGADLGQRSWEGFVRACRLDLAR